MTLKQIANLLNTVIVPNTLGQDTTIAEDLSNVVELGVKIASMNASEVKDYLGKFAVGVINNWVDTKSYKNETFGIFVNTIEYGGVLQKSKARLLKAMDTPILSLVSVNDQENAPDYNDGHYYGTQTDSVIYSKDIGYLLPYSIPVEMFKKSFKNAIEVQKLVAMIEANADSTLKVELNGLAKAMLRKLALACNTYRTIPLLSTYNDANNYESSDPGFVTLENWKNNERFKIWCEEVIINLKKYVTDINTKYNDGTIETFTRAEDVRTVLLTEFDTALTFSNADIYHNELVSIGEHYTTNFWQNAGTELLPQMSDESTHDQIVELDGEENTVISHVVGLIYDQYSLFSTTKLDKTTSDYIAKGDFYTMFHHLVKSYTIDTRDTGLLLTMA